MLGRILVFLGGLLALVLFSALLIPYFVDWTDFRRDFEDQASRILGKKVVVHGRVEARILPFPSVTLHDVRAGTDADGSPLIQVARFSMDAELAPFLSGEARIFDMRIEEPKAKIRLLKDGTLDWMRGSRAEIPARTVVLESVQIEGGQIEFIDEQSGRNRVVTGLNADMSANSLAGPWKAEGRAAVDGHPGSFSLSSSEPDYAAGRMGLRVRVVPDEHPVEVDLDGAIAATAGKPAYSGSFAFSFREDEKQKQAGQSLFSSPRTRGSFELTNESVRISSYRMELGGSENPYVVTGEATLDTGAKPEFLLTADGQQIDVARFAPPVVQTGKTSRQPTVSVRQRIEAFAAMVARIPVPQVPGKASISLPALVSDDTTIRDIRLDVRPEGSGWQVVNAVATLPGRTQLEAKGSLTLLGGPAFNGNLLLASNQPSGLANWLSGSVDPAIRQLNAAGFSADVSLTTLNQRFNNLELAIGDASLKGELERRSDGKTSNLSIDLAGNEIDLDALKALGSLALGDQVGSSVLDHRIDAKFKADRFNMAGVTANHVETAFTMAGGVLTLEKMTAGDIAGAEVKATGQLQGSLLKYAGKGTVNLHAPDMQPFFTMLQQKLPNHPFLSRLAASAPWYANSDLAVDVSVNSENGGANVAVSGTVNGSRLSAVAKMPDFLSITDDTAMSLEAVLKNQSTAILFGQAGLDPLPFDADGEGLLSVKLNGTLGSPAQTDIRFSTERTHFSMSGSFAVAAANFGEGSADVALESADIEPYLIMNAVGLPQLGGGMAVKANAKVAVDAQKIAFSSVGGQVGGNPFSGNLAVQRAAPYPVSGDLSVRTADLAWLGDAIYGPVIDPESGALNAKPLAMAAFPQLKASVSLKAENFEAGPFGTITGLAAKVTHDSGSLSLDDVTGGFMGGKLTGRLAMSTGEGAGIFRTKIAVTDANPEPILWANANGPVATGRVAIDLTAESTGKSVGEILKSAGGSGEIRAGGLVLKGLNPGALPPILQAADGLQQPIDAPKVRPLVDQNLWQGEIGLGDVALPFSLNGGALHFQNLRAGIDPVTLAGDATVDIAASTVNGDLDLLFNPGTEAVAGAEPSLRLNYNGPLAAPALTIDVSTLSNYLSLRAFEKERRRVEAMQASVLEKQRLRREVTLYRSQAAERQAEKERVEAEAKAKAEEEARLKAAAEERLRQEKEQQERLQQQQQQQPVPERQSAPILVVPPTENAIRDLAPENAPVNP
ncbi:MULTISPECIES: AsmA family protein [Rhizobium/Agrobacterium group]|uniref:AsmA family protein n=1 Tax=Rhizobium/Agrobacterium group TaxID=227290 RepID=UPI0022FFFA77|nr:MULTISPECIES: AsmA-like C-terminal region-containing protein [Rhizobium/Agrobacterium group]MDA5633891.1 AsmA-like C-terminal region-containing protein [Agrobacterium sp. ST15.16.024]MDF1889406.1 AsmA-like C-terminal region-containing protein [Rhizobium rhizogenes]